MWCCCQASCKFLDEAGVPFQKRPEEGSMRGLAFVRDPDDYWVEIVQRGLTI
jgi:lactoylglutathione lyase